MRYKVRAKDRPAYWDLLRFLRRKPDTDVFVTSPRRRTIATGDLSEETREGILERGGEVDEDTQYGPG